MLGMLSRNNRATACVLRYSIDPAGAIVDLALGRAQDGHGGLDRFSGISGAVGSNFADHAGPLTEMVLLGNLAVRSHEIVRWDAEANSAGSAGADAFLGTEYRDGWSLGK